MPNLRIERVFDAPRTLVFEAWTDAEHFAKWWGPTPFTGRVAEFDVRPGGRMLYAMVADDGTEYWNGGTFEEIVPPERLVFIQYFSDSEGNKIAPESYGLSSDLPAGVVVTVTLDDLGGKTKMTLEQTVPLDVAKANQMIEGWNQSLDKLAATLS
jgi:uncharacterized protein YndB with AHSA1/START domain